jgi:hypothetical protein
VFFWPFPSKSSTLIDPFDRNFDIRNTHQVFFWRFPSKSSTLMDPLDRKIFGILKKTRQTPLDLISSVYFSTRSVRLDLSTNSLHSCSSIIPPLPPLLRACYFEKKLTDRTQILLVKHIFATHIEPKPYYYFQEAFLLAGLVPLNVYAVLFSLQNTETATIH